MSVLWGISVRLCYVIRRPHVPQFHFPLQLDYRLREISERTRRANEGHYHTSSQDHLLQTLSIAVVFHGFKAYILYMYIYV